MVIKKLNIIVLLFSFCCLFVFTQTVHAQQPDVYEKHTSIPTPRQEAAVVAIDNKIYVIGGFSTNSRESVDVVEVYDTVNDIWTTVSPLPKKLHHPAAAVHGGKIFVVGGFEYTYPVITHWLATNYLFIYNPILDEWERGPDMPTARGALAAKFIDGILYAVGGENTIQYGIASRIFDLVNYPVNEAYNPKNDSWEKKTPMPTPRNHVASAVIDGKLYVIGGRQMDPSDNLSVNEVYNPQTDSWSSLEPMPTPRSGITASTLNGTIFVFGGENLERAMDTNEQFIPGKGWVTHTPMPLPLHGLGSAGIGDRIYLLGGSPISGGGWNVTSNNFSYYNPNVIPEFGLTVYFILLMALVSLIIFSKIGKKKRVTFKLLSNF